MISNWYLSLLVHQKYAQIRKKLQIPVATYTWMASMFMAVLTYLPELPPWKLSFDTKTKQSSPFICHWICWEWVPKAYMGFVSLQQLRFCFSGWQCLDNSSTLLHTVCSHCDVLCMQFQQMNWSDCRGLFYFRCLGHLLQSWLESCCIQSQHQLQVYALSPLFNFLFASRVQPLIYISIGEVYWLNLRAFFQKAYSQSLLD